MFELIWTWIQAHVPDALKIVSGIKLFADTGVSFKKLAPEKLEMKEAAQVYMTETLAVAKDQTKEVEERQMELDARTELTESMVKLTAIEATYNIARYAIFTASATFLFHLLTHFLTRSKKQ
ncbi:MAG TPA: hypothetical protein VEP90_05320 [Methylomirabilota bacterium]|nr:hypothetical protein [Methylomirabilota bacterium]